MSGEHKLYELTRVVFPSAEFTDYGYLFVRWSVNYDKEFDNAF